MSSVWEARHRLLIKQLDELADLLSSAEPPELAVLTKYTVRLLATAAMLVRQHHVNKHGQCKYCCWTDGADDSGAGDLGALSFERPASL